MGERQVVLFVGDAFRYERALRERDAALRAEDPACERHLHFADEVDVPSLEMELRSSSLFALGRHFVIRDADRARSPKPLGELLKQTLPSGTYVSLTASSELKASNPIAKAAKTIDGFVSLPSPRGRGIQKAAREILDAEGVSGVDPTTLQELVLRSGGDLLTLGQEAKKLRAFSHNTGVDKGTVRSLAFPSAEQTVYPLYDRIGEGDLRGALRELDALRDPPGRVLGGVVRHVTRLAMIRLLLDRKTPWAKMTSLIGTPEWLLRRLVAQAKGRSMNDLAGALRLGIRLDQQIKRGEISPADALMTMVLAATTPA